MTAAGLTDKGMKREENQDSFAIEENMRLFLLADGMGGHFGGEIASQTAIKEIKNYWIKSYNKEKPVWDNIKEAINIANREIRGYKKNMGTTLEVFTIAENRGWIGHIGDSRIYRYRQNTLELLTRDHTRVRELIEAGDLDPEMAKMYPFQHIITKALGVEEEVIADIFDIDLMAGDIIMMCSDGLTGDLAKKIVSEEEIQKILNEKMDTDISCQELVDIANEEGGPDNITVVMIKIEEDDL